MELKKLSFGGQTMVAPLKTVVLKRPSDAFRSSQTIESEWKDLDYLRPPHLERAARDHRQFCSLIEEAGAKVCYLPYDASTGLDSIYTHDPLLMTDAGAVILQTGKEARRGEGPAFAAALEGWGVPVLGTIDGDSTAEGGDMLWLDASTLVVGRGFRTNAAGVGALTALLKLRGVSVIPVELPYWNGPREVLHLQSFISLLDDALALVYRRLLPVPLFETLDDRGFELVDVPDEEYESLGCNVLALAPRNIVMVSGNPETRSRIEAAGCRVSEFDGSEICFPGSGGPTCLTRALLRA